MKRMFRTIALVVLVAFMVTGLVPPAMSQEVFLPEPTKMVSLSPTFAPCVLRGVKLDAKNPFRFDFIVDEGDSGLKGEDFKAESQKLIKYFLAALTTPEQDLWVNLSPYESDRIIEDNFGRTAMGRDLLAQDYILKQLTSSLMYPDGALGKKFWEEVYRRTYEKFGTTDIPVDTFNKVWIVPERAVIYESQETPVEGKSRNLAAYIDEARLKVMLESDYLAQEKAKGIGDRAQGIEDKDRGDRGNYALNSKLSALASQGAKDTQELSKQIIREVILPALETEINVGKNFAPLRQVYHSLLLAVWLKKKMKTAVPLVTDTTAPTRGNILSLLFINQKKTGGIETPDPKAEIRDIYDHYVEAFQKGVYNLIREDRDFYSDELIPRKYFSGGVVMGAAEAAMVTKVGVPESAQNMQAVAVNLKTQSNDSVTPRDMTRRSALRNLIFAGIGAFVVSPLLGAQKTPLPVAPRPQNVPPAKPQPAVPQFPAKLSMSPKDAQRVTQAVQAVLFKIEQWEGKKVLTWNNLFSRTYLKMSFEEMGGVIASLLPFCNAFKANGLTIGETTELLLGLAEKESSLGAAMSQKNGNGQGLYQYDSPDIFWKTIRKMKDDPNFGNFLKTYFPDVYSYTATRWDLIDWTKVQQWEMDTKLNLASTMFRANLVLANMAARVDAPLSLQDRNLVRQNYVKWPKGEVSPRAKGDYFPAFIFYTERGYRKTLLKQMMLTGWNTGSGRSNVFYHTVVWHVLFCGTFDIRTRKTLDIAEAKYGPRKDPKSQVKNFNTAIRAMYTHYKIPIPGYLPNPLFGEAFHNTMKAAVIGGADFWPTMPDSQRHPPDNAQVQENVGVDYGDTDRASAVTTDNVGGIDLNTQNLDMILKGQGGNMEFEVTPDQLKMLKENINGFVPVILNVQPVQDVPMFLGLGGKTANST